MLTREKIILNLLKQVNRPLAKTVFVKLIFLLRHETTLKGTQNFYDFVPYKYGPFSFTLYRDLDRLRKNGYIKPEEDDIALCKPNPDSTKKNEGLTKSIKSAVGEIVRRYGQMNKNTLINNVYCSYPWFALNSELPQRSLVSIQPPKKASPAVYTTGYEGKSVEAFFNHLLKKGIKAVIDVRANPISRKYGFAGSRLRQFCENLGFEYLHFPSLGVSSNDRIGLGSFASYQHLLSQYEKTILPKRHTEVKKLGQFMIQKPSVLVCVEQDFQCCHRSRLANSVADITGMKISHL